jgi:signal transduction histidine kinase
LIQVKASVLGQKTSGPYQVLELQEGQRLFDALLATNLGSLPPLEPGSRVEVAGVCDTGALPAPFEGKAGLPGLGAGQPHLWLRGPRDVAVLQGPPWWTWKRVATLIGALLTVLLVAVLWIHFLRRRLERQQAARLSFSRQILQSQESERRRIAANLHDSLGQNLLVIKNQARLALQPAKDEPALRESLDQISGMASQAIEEIRQITHGLRPYQLDRLGLTQAIRAAINRVSENGPVQLASDVEDIDGVLDKESEIHVYRIVQESVNNIMKHSGATEATVVIRRRPGRISLSIRDNGRGFDAGLWSSNTRATGFGLSSIGERARILGGHLTVDSRPGAGAGLRIEIPVQEG